MNISVGSRVGFIWWGKEGPVPAEGIVTKVWGKGDYGTYLVQPKIEYLVPAHDVKWSQGRPKVKAGKKKRSMISFMSRT